MKWKIFFQVNMIDSNSSSEQEDTVVSFRKTPKRKSDVLSSSDEEELNLSAVLQSTPISQERQEFEMFKKNLMRPYLATS